MSKEKEKNSLSGVLAKFNDKTIKVGYENGKINPDIYLEFIRSTTKEDKEQAKKHGSNIFETPFCMVELTEDNKTVTGFLLTNEMAVLLHQSLKQILIQIITD
jgi:hypothetical protein